MVKDRRKYLRQMIRQSAQLRSDHLHRLNQKADASDAKRLRNIIRGERMRATYSKLCYFYTGEYLQNLPTCAVYSVQFNVDDWRALGCESGKSANFITPRQLKDN